MKKIFFALFLFFSINCKADDFTEPFYVSLRSNEVNLRTGPGNEYPIKFVYQLKGLPLKVVGEYDNWYKVKDKDNDEGWVNKNLTTKKRTLIVVNGTQIMYKKNDLESNPLYRLEENVIATYKKCDTIWCKVEVNNETGWVESKNMWGYDL